MTIETTTSQLGVRCSSTRLARRQKDRKLYSVLVGSVLASTGDHNTDETSIPHASALNYRTFRLPCTHQRFTK